MSRGKNLAELLMPYGLTITLDDDDIVTDAVVITRITSASGVTRLGIAESAGLDWIMRTGMISAAQAIDEAPAGMVVEDDDE